MIEIKNIFKTFEGTEVLHDISATFEGGKTNLIIGKSGSGKTVLVKCMVGLFGVDNGSIIFGNQDFTRMGQKAKREIRKQIGMLFQGGALFDSKTVQENVAFPLEMFTSMTQKEKRIRVDQCLDRVNLVGQNNKYPAEISGGMKKRVGIARAIVMNPKYLFCDEPNSGLDPMTAIVIDKLIEEITKEYSITTIINTHDMNSVMEIGDSILLLHEGKVHWQGNHSQVLQANNKELDDFIFASEFLQKAKKAMLSEK